MIISRLFARECLGIAFSDSVIFGIHWRRNREKQGCIGIYESSRIERDALSAFVEKHALQWVRASMAVPYASAWFGEVVISGKFERNPAQLLMGEKAKHCPNHPDIRVDYKQQYDYTHKRSTLYYAMAIESDIAKLEAHATIAKLNLKLIDIDYYAMLHALLNFGNITLKPTCHYVAIIESVSLTHVFVFNDLHIISGKIFNTKEDADVLEWLAIIESKMNVRVEKIIIYGSSHYHFNTNNSWPIECLPSFTITSPTKSLAVMDSFHLTALGLALLGVR